VAAARLYSLLCFAVTVCRRTSLLLCCSIFSVVYARRLLLSYEINNSVTVCARAVSWTGSRLSQNVALLSCFTVQQMLSLDKKDEVLLTSVHRRCIIAFVGPRAVVSQSSCRPNPFHNHHPNK